MRKIRKNRPKAKVGPNPVKEAILDALDKCWDGKLPFKELEEAIRLTRRW